MKKKIFSRGLYIEGLKQLRIIGFITLALFMLAELSTPVISYIQYLTTSDKSLITVSALDFLDAVPIIIVVPIIVVPIMLLSLFSFMNRRSSSDFYHSLPYTRICLLTSYMAAVFTWIIGVTVISGLTGVLAVVCLPKLFVISFTGAFDIILSFIAMTLLVTASMTAAMSITGTFLANITLSGLIIFLPRIIMYVITFAIGNIAPIISRVQTASIFELRYNVLVSYIASIFTGGSGSAITDNLECDIYTIIIAVLIGAAAVLLFCRRKSETAGSPAPGKRVQAAIRIALAMLFCVIFTAMLITGELEVAWAIVGYLFSVIVYFAYELITTRRWSSVPSAAPGLLVLLALNLLVVGIVFGGSAIAHSYMPEASELSAVRIIADDEMDYYDSQSFLSYAENKSQKIDITDSDAIEAAADALRRSTEASKNGDFYNGAAYEDQNAANLQYYKLAFVSKNGTVRNRMIVITPEGMQLIIKALTGLESYNNVFTNIPDDLERSAVSRSGISGNRYSLTDNDYTEILASLRTEVKEVGFDKWYKALTEYSEMSFDISYTTDPDLADITVPVFAETTPKTFDLMLGKLYNSTKTLQDTVLDYISDYDKACATLDYFSIGISALRPADNSAIGGYMSEDFIQGCDDKAANVSLSSAKAEYHKLAEAIRSCNKTPSITNGYIEAMLSYRYEKDGQYQYVSELIILPLPEDFDFAEPYFQKISASYNYVEKIYRDGDIDEYTVSKTGGADASTDTAVSADDQTAAPVTAAAQS